MLTSKNADDVFVRIYPLYRRAACLLVFFAVWIAAGRLYAAPLESGFALAPSSSASLNEKAAAYQQARSLVLTVAAKYEKTPYRYAGADRNGIDCSGLVYVSFREALGVTVPRTTVSLYAWVEKIPLEDARPGDLLFFVTGGGPISHVGIITGDRRFIHAASEGRDTGVIYSTLNESYWSRTFAGAGRVFPDGGGTAGKNTLPVVSNNPVNPGNVQSPVKKEREKIGMLMGAGIAPTWNISFNSGNAVRGMAGQFMIGTEEKPFGKSMILGLEARPEWDGMLGVFRIPLTVSWGLDEKWRIFAGPAISFGKAEVKLSNGNIREYPHSNNAWFGAAGITAAPFAFSIAGTSLAPYAELAWQSYLSNGGGFKSEDITAGLRFSTGLRLTWQM